MTAGVTMEKQFEVYLQSVSAPAEFPRMWHPHALVIFPVSGQLILELSGQRHPLKQGWAAVLPPETPYRAQPDGDNFSAATLLLHEPIKEIFRRREFAPGADFFARLAQPRILRPDRETAEWLNALFLQLLAAVEEESRQACAQDLLELIVFHLGRFMGPDSDTAAEEIRNEALDPPDVTRLIKRVMQYIGEHYSAPLSLTKIAGEFWVSPSYLSRQFKRNLGVGLAEYIAARRIYHAKLLLLSQEKSISEVALDVGFQNISHFNAVFRKQVGMSPREFQKQHRGRLYPFD